MIVGVFIVLIVEDSSQAPRDAGLISGGAALKAWLAYVGISVSLEGSRLFKASMTTLLHVLLPTSRVIS